MAFILADRVRETSTTTGTGTFTLAGAVSGYRAFSAALSNGDTCFYFIAMGAAWESGIGTYTGGTLARTTVIESTNANAEVNFGSGTKDVWIGLPGTYAMPLRHMAYAASVFSLGANRATNPAFQVNYSAASAATGLEVVAAAAGSRATISALSSGTNEGLSINGKGSGTVRLGDVSTGAIEFSRNAVPTASDGAALGTSSLMWSDAFFASGAVIDFNNGNVTLTHVSGALALLGNLDLYPSASVDRHVRIGTSTNYYWDLAGDGDNFTINEAGDTAKKRFRIIYNAGSPYISIPMTTAASSTTAGAFVVAGGLASNALSYFNGFNSTFGLFSGTVAGYGADMISLDISGGVGRIASFGANTSTVGTFSLVGYSSNASVSAVCITTTTAGVVQFPNAGTTASAANAFLDGSNSLIKSTSSLRYKRSFTPFAATANDNIMMSAGRVRDIVMALRPGSYFSVARSDDPTRLFFGLGAEHVAAISSSLVNFDASGRPDGVMYDRVGVLVLSVVQEHEQKIARLETELAALKPA